MARGKVNRITYERFGILVSDFPAYKENGTLSGDLTRVQSMSYGFQHPALDVKSVGSDQLITQGGESPIVRQPEVNCDISYIFSSGENEETIGFHLGSDGSILKNFFEAPKTDDVNLILIADQGCGHRDLNNVTDPQGFSDYNLIGFGNAFLTQYSYSAKVGSLPQCSISYACSNLRFDEYNPESPPELPSVRLGVDNVFSEEKLFIDQESFNTHTENDLPSIMPGAIVVDITKKAGRHGGAKIEDLEASIQSIDIDIPISRQDIYGFGSNYVFDRKLKFPIIASVSIEMILTNMNTGQIESFFLEGSRYDMIVTHSERDSSGAIQSVNSFKIQEAQLKSQNYNQSIGPNASVSSDFTFGISPSGGFSFYRE